MKESIKPFRLINCVEIKQLNDEFTERLIHWNDQYALLPLSGQITQADGIMFNKGHILYYDAQQPVVLISQEIIPLIKTSLFKDLNSCFDTISCTALRTLLVSLTQLPTIQEQTHKSMTFNPESWFYKGAPTLAYSLKLDTHLAHIILSPEWVLNKLPLLKKNNQPLNDLEEALGPQQIKCNVQLDAIRLKLNDIINLKVGDVIKTDQKCTTSFTLKQIQQSICQVDLGEHQQFKSIQIVSSI